MTPIKLNFYFFKVKIVGGSTNNDIQIRAGNFDNFVKNFGQNFTKFRKKYFETKYINFEKKFRNYKISKFVKKFRNFKVRNFYFEIYKFRSFQISK